MPAPVNIQDGDTGVVARVTKFGQLVVAPIQYSTPIAVDLDVTGVAFNFIGPAQGQQIVITDIIASANKDVSNVDPADVTIYAADTVDSLVESPVIVAPQLTRANNLALTGLNLIVDEGKFVNAKTTDTIITVTIMFYRVPVKDNA